MSAAKLSSVRLWFASVSLMCVTLRTGLAAEPPFRAHVIDAEATNSACAALDVNQDGRLDVIAGTWWYEAPNWQRHFVRDVEVIRGRFDDYSNLLLDVNGDGWQDLVSANYRSSKLYWVENPGPAAAIASGAGDGDLKAAAWPVHLIAEPGPMETGRLHDIDGDGQPDVLPNGVRFAAWWELIREPQSGSDAPSHRWMRHELPAELAGHGVGFGDIDGDGRGDVVGPTGWAQRPDDARKDRWPYHAEFLLHRDTSIPILVVDVDEDGDNDLVWGRGHDAGVYWMEQGTSAGGDSSRSRSWTMHAIDTSWSQTHAPLWGDLDNDGRPELIAGKRYMGHDGRDPGEYDPLMVCAYRFDAATKTWRRQVLCESWRIGFGLDPKLVDLDSDGDLDIVCPGRSGLYWLENRLGDDAVDEGDGRLAAASYSDHAQLLIHKDEAGEQQPVASHADWAKRRSHILAAITEVTGPLPEPGRRVPLDVRVIEEQETEHYVRRRITFAAEPGDRVPAYVLIPRGLKQSVSAMLCLHQTTASGKDEPAGLAGDPSLDYAHELANRGFVCLVPDLPGFGEYAYDFEGPSIDYDSGLMKIVWNNVRAIDLLEQLPEVNRDRIGCIGHSLGAHAGVFTAVFDQRIRLVVSSCGFTAFADDDVESWSGPRYMPRIATAYGNDAARLPFDFHEVLAALAPRPVFVNAPVEDGDFAVAGVRQVAASASAVYELLDSADKLTIVYPPGGHAFPPAVQEQCYDWIAGQWK
jgi:dienelactone hydrolase